LPQAILFHVNRNIRLRNYSFEDCFKGRNIFSMPRLSQYIFSVLLVNCNGLRLNKEAHDKDPFGLEIPMFENEGEGFSQPFSQQDFIYGETNSGLRLTLENKISALSPTDKPTLYFLGDSLARQMATVACAVVQKSHHVDREFGKWRTRDHQCTGELGNVVFGWASHLDPSKVANFKKRYPAPTLVIYEASAYWEKKTPSKWKEADRQSYTDLANQTMHAYAKDAPNAALKVFLSHKPCTNMKWKTPTEDEIKQFNDIHVALAKSEQVSIVDGYSFTEKLGCNATADGRHWDKYVFQEVNIALDA